MASRWSQVSASRAEIEVGRNPLRHGRRARTKKISSRYGIYVRIQVLMERSASLGSEPSLRYPHSSQSARHSLAYFIHLAS